MVIDPCLAHSQRWKGDFQCVINSFQKKRNAMNMPIQYVRRVAKKICTCDLDDDDTLEDDVSQQKISEEAIREIATMKSFFTNLTPEEKTKLGNGQPILLKMLDSLSPEMTGMLLFLNITHDALHGKYDRLKHVDKSTEWCEEIIQLPLPVTYVGLLIGKGGRKLKDISETYKCQIHVKGVDLKNPQNFVRVDDVSVSLRWKKEHEEKIPTLKAHLLALAGTICKKRKIHNEAVKAHAALRKKMVMQPSPSSGTRYKRYGHVSTNVKAVNEKQFEKHKLGKSKSSEERLANKEKRVLDGAYCSHCFAKYPSRVQKEEDDVSSCSDSEDEDQLPEVEDVRPDPHADGICRYHPGYLIPVSNGEKNKHGRPLESQWSCCGEPMSLEGLHDRDMKVEGTYSSHASTGCTRGRHRWHPAGRKDAAAHQSRHKKCEKLLEDEDFVVFVREKDKKSWALHFPVIR